MFFSEVELSSAGLQMIGVVHDMTSKLVKIYCIEIEFQTAFFEMFVVQYGTSFLAKISKIVFIIKIKTSSLLDWVVPVII